MRKFMALLVTLFLLCGLWMTAAGAEDTSPGSPVFHWLSYDARFAFATTVSEPFGLDASIERFFPNSVGNTLFIRLEAVEGKLSDGAFNSRLFRLILPDGSMVEPLMYQEPNWSMMGGINMPDAMQDYFHIVYDRGPLTDETLGEGSIAVYETVDGEPVAIISLADVPPYTPEE